MRLSGLRIALVGPLAPPSGGMANQTAQLAELLRADGAAVQLIQVNAPYWPAWVARVRGLRAALRLPAYLARLWTVAAAVDLFHVMANSGWSWHLHAAPAIWIARLRGKAVVLNYRGGQADEFFARRPRLVSASMKRADAILVPSPYLAQVFEKYGFPTQIVPNVIDLARFAPAAPARKSGSAPLLLVARNLEAIYDNASALHAFAIVRQAWPDARLIVAGSGSELAALEELARQLGLAGAVQFAGRVENAAMAGLYQACDVVLNPSLADNMPISVLEALACAVPVVSTNVGGIPALLEDGVTALLVAPNDPPAMAQAVLSLLRDPAKATRMGAAGCAHVRQFGWNQVAPRLLAQYRRVLQTPRPGLYTRLVSALLFPLHERFKRHASVTLLRHMERSQWWSAQRLEQWQLTRLRALLTHVQAHVPYYRDLFARLGFHAGQVQSLADLARLPLLGKGEIRAAGDAFKSVQARELMRCNTGGSSGQPLIFFIGKERISHDVAAKWRATRWWGVDIGDREVVVWGSPIELKAQDRVRMLRDRLLRSTLLPAFEMSAAKLDRFVERIRRTRPRMLFGYPSALSHIARHARARNIALNGLGIRVACVTSERLYDEQRDLIGATFGCRVANGYGGRDAGFIAHECPEGGMHITAEDIIVEIVDARGRPVPVGTTGSIVVTHLATGDFPFIRYATGDVGALDSKPCPCGRGLPLLKSIEGRNTDFVVARDGTVMHGLALVYILRDLPQVRAFKIIQESVHLTRVLLVALPLLDECAREKIVSQFRARLGAGVEIVIDEVADIAPEASGKFRYVVSKVVPA
jgi:phenylacetate-CoA ligase